MTPPHDVPYPLFCWQRSDGWVIAFVSGDGSWRWHGTVPNNASQDYWAGVCDYVIQKARQRGYIQ